MDNRHIFIVAEMSANHNQDYGRAEAIVYAAKEAGADAVKLQTYRPDTMTIDSGRTEFLVRGGLWDGERLYDLYKRGWMPWHWQSRLKELADNIGIELFSTPYDRTAVEFLETIGVARYKIASYELVDLPLIKYVAKTGKPMVMSTGMATLEEIKEAVNIAVDGGAMDITLLKCVSAYPALAEDMNLRSIPDLYIQFVMARSWGVKVNVGLSDHTLGIATPIVAVALGACMVEKHFTLSRQVKTLDSDFSLETQEFKVMVDGIREAEKALGEKMVGVVEAEAKGRMLRRSLFVVEDTKEGDEFTEMNVRSIRPGDGLPPKHLLDVIGKRAPRDIEKGTPLGWDLVS